MASPRRTFLNKINKRIATLTKKGADKNLLLDEVRRRGPSGVFITEFDQVNIEPSLWEEDKEHIQKALENIVPMYWNAREKAMKPYENFIGPLRANQEELELKAYFEYMTDFQNLVQNYYDLLLELDRAGEAYKKDSPEMQEYLKLLSDEGSSLYHHGEEIPFSKRMYMINNIRKISEGLR